MQVGFIGLGIMGTPMAAHLLKAGHKLYLRNLGKISQDLIGARAVVCTATAASRTEVPSGTTPVW